jgi:hypothetical protein
MGTQVQDLEIVVRCYGHVAEHWDPGADEIDHEATDASWDERIENELRAAFPEARVEVVRHPHDSGFGRTEIYGALDWERQEQIEFEVDAVIQGTFDHSEEWVVFTAR